MSAFMLFESKKITDAERLEAYTAKAPKTVAEFGGTYRVIGGNPAVIEGDWRPTYLVLLEFPSVEQARAWYNSPGYEPLKQERLASVDANGIIIEGLS
ncbi:DUF1330 domain-containing protein [Streptomyces pseudoechinosporeus]